MKKNSFNDLSGIRLNLYSKFIGDFKEKGFNIKDEVKNLEFKDDINKKSPIDFSFTCRVEYDNKHYDNAKINFHANERDNCFVVRIYLDNLSSPDNKGIRREYPYNFGKEK